MKVQNYVASKDAATLFAQWALRVGMKLAKAAVIVVVFLVAFSLGLFIVAALFGR